MYNSKEKLAELIYCIKNFQTVSESQLTKLSRSAETANVRINSIPAYNISWDAERVVWVESQRAYLIYEFATVLLIRKLELTNPTSPKLQRIYNKFDYYFDEEYPKLYKNSSIWTYLNDLFYTYDDRFLATSFTLDELKQINTALDRKYVEWRYTDEFKNSEYSADIIKICADGLASEYINIY